MDKTTILTDTKEKTNEKVPIAILSCFLIAFILQGVLKISGVFIFEKALNWEIFKIIDSDKTLQIIYYSIINIIAVYSMSFAFTKSYYSRKWYHILIIIFGTSIITYLRMTLNTKIVVEFIYDILLYICIPTFISLTMDKDKRVFKNFTLDSIIITITIQIILYLCFLGLSYWSGLLNSLLPVTQTILYSSVHFLVFFEVYIGLYMIMLSFNMVLRKNI